MLIWLAVIHLYFGKWHLQVLDAEDEDELLPVVVAEVVEPVCEELDDELVLLLLPEEVVEAELETELDEALEVDEAEDEDEEAPATANKTL